MGCHTDCCDDPCCAVTTDAATTGADVVYMQSIALLILCLACAHANGEVNSKELLDDAGLDLETNDVESTSAIATQTTHGPSALSLEAIRT